MKKRIILALVCSIQAVHSTQEAVCCVPFIDLNLMPTIRNKITERFSQLLLNDPVIIEDATAHRYKIKNSAMAYGAGKGISNSYWVDKSAIQFVNEKSAIKRAFFIRPLFIPEIKTTVSTGTLLRIADESSATYIGWMIDPASKQYVSCAIEKKNCCIPYDDPGKQKQAFLQLIRYWAQQQPEKIPYALGGSTIISTINPHTQPHQKVYTKGLCLDDASSLCTGIDCAHLIYLASRISGVPLKTTNTIGLKKELIPFTKQDVLEAGDIALWKGHAVIITDPAQGLIAEANGYYGFVHEIPFSQAFAGIKTANDLLSAYHTGKPITRLNRFGKSIELITDMKLYKLPYQR